MILALLPLAVEALLTDRTFKLNTTSARCVYDTALQVKNYLDNNRQKANIFEREILTLLEGCFCNKGSTAK